jgi:hypothetical protein
MHRATFSKSTWVTLPTYILKEWKISVRETVAQAFIREAARDGAVSIATAPGWRLPRRPFERKAG